MAALVMALGPDCVAAAGSYRATEPGEGDYTTYCAPCHGVRGDGDGRSRRCSFVALPGTAMCG